MKPLKGNRCHSSEVSVPFPLMLWIHPSLFLSLSNWMIPLIYPCHWVLQEVKCSIRRGGNLSSRVSIEWDSLWYVFNSFDSHFGILIFPHASDDKRPFHSYFFRSLRPQAYLLRNGLPILSSRHECQLRKWFPVATRLVKLPVRWEVHLRT